VGSIADNFINPSDEQTAYQILAINSDKLNEDFLLQFRLWIDCTLLRTQPKIKKRSHLLGIFLQNLWHFPLGNRAINLEIAIAGFEGSAKILTREVLPTNVGENPKRFSSSIPQSDFGRSLRKP
jgi:ABC-type uncharacterized transport system YnjBCD ATPase subunit